MGSNLKKPSCAHIPVGMVGCRDGLSSGQIFTEAQTLRVLCVGRPPDHRAGAAEISHNLMASSEMPRAFIPAFQPPILNDESLGQVV